MRQCDGGYHLWKYYHTENPSPETPVPTFVYACSFGCERLLCVPGVFQMDECPHDIGFVFDPLVQNDRDVFMCMQCLWSPDPESELHQELSKVWMQRLFWCGPVCSDHGEVPWPEDVDLQMLDYRERPSKLCSWCGHKHVMPRADIKPLSDEWRDFMEEECDSWLK